MEEREEGDGGHVESSHDEGKMGASPRRWRWRGNWRAPPRTYRFSKEGRRDSDRIDACI